MTMPPAVEAKNGAPPPGRRERNKRIKEELIREAARALFLDKGYDATTLREVADRADVGFGTVFAYANDKAGLLAMVFVEELKRLPAIFPAPGARADVLDELVEGLMHLYAFWATIPSLAGLVLQQMEFYGDNPHMETIVARRSQARRELQVWLDALLEKGRIAPDTDIPRAADTLFAVYTSAVREWSATHPGDLGAAESRLRELLALPVRGLLAAPAQSVNAAARRTGTA